MRTFVHPLPTGRLGLQTAGVTYVCIRSYVSPLVYIPPPCGGNLFPLSGMVVLRSHACPLTLSRYSTSPPSASNVPRARMLNRRVQYSPGVGLDPPLPGYPTQGLNPRQKGDGPVDDLPPFELLPIAITGVLHFPVRVTEILNLPSRHLGVTFSITKFHDLPLLCPPDTAKGRPPTKPLLVLPSWVVLVIVLPLCLWVFLVYASHTASITSTVAAMRRYHISHLIFCQPR